MDTAVILEAVKKVMPAVSKDDQTTNTDTIVFSDGWARSFNGSLSVSYPLDLPFNCAVRGAELSRVLSKIKSKSMEITFEDNVLKIKAGKTNVKLNSLEDDTQIQNLLDSLNLGDQEFFPIPEDMMEGIRLCSHSMCTVSALAFLAGMRFTGNEILSSDNHRVGAYYMENQELNFDFSIPREGVNGLLKIGIQPTQMAVDKSWIHVQSEDGIIYSAKLLEEKYPDDQVRQILPDEEQIKEMGEIFTFPEGMEESLDRVSVLASKDDENAATYVSIYGEGNGIVVRGVQQAGEILDVLPTENPLPDGKVININPELLESILKVTRNFQFGENRVYFDTGKFRHVVACVIG